MPASPYPPLAVIGGGNMAQAILTGFRDSVPLYPFSVAVAEPDQKKHPHLATVADAVVSDGPAAIHWLREKEGPANPGQVLLAVKPQMLANVASELRPHLDRRRIVISILAGTPTRTIRDLLGPSAAVVRAMPNLPARIRQGTTAVCLGAGAKPGDDSFSLELFRGVGQLVVSLDESLMDVFTAVAGSGPAYLFYLAEAMTRAAVDLGFDEDTARDIVKETLAGSASLFAQSFEDPAALRAAVTSKGGTTEAAITTLDNAGAMDAIIRAITAARDRGRELAGG